MLNEVDDVKSPQNLSALDSRARSSQPGPTSTSGPSNMGTGEYLCAVPSDMLIGRYTVQTVESAHMGPSPSTVPAGLTAT